MSAVEMGSVLQFVNLMEHKERLSEKHFSNLCVSSLTTPPAMNHFTQRIISYTMTLQLIKLPCFITQITIIIRDERV